MITLHGVLILVLMEDTLREPNKIAIKMGQLSLNPCFNGRYSQRSFALQTLEADMS